MRLAAEDLAGERGGEQVFSGISFSLRGGDALVVGGPNGSGKSTLLRVVAGLLPAAAGRVIVDADGADEPGEACHYLGHLDALKAALTVEENLVFWCRFLGAPRLSPFEALKAVGLSRIAHLPFGCLSAGQRRRTAIARLLVSHRPVWLLDEPTAGLDHDSEMRLAELMQAHLDEGGIVLAATHQPLGIEGARELRMGERG